MTTPTDRAAKLASEAEAWREVARLIATERPAPDGLCTVVYSLRWHPPRISDALKDRMERRIRGHVNLTERGKWSQSFDTPGRRGPRVLAALLLAHVVEDEQARRAK